MKWIDLILMVLSIAALIGSLIVMLVLNDLGSFTDSLSSGELTGLLDPSLISGFVEQIRMVLVLGWIYTLLVFIVSAYGVWNGWKNFRKK